MNLLHHTESRAGFVVIRRRGGVNSYLGTLRKEAA
jgi:hypothetical protein